MWISGRQVSSSGWIENALRRASAGRRTLEFATLDFWTPPQSLLPQIALVADRIRAAVRRNEGCVVRLERRDIEDLDGDDVLACPSELDPPPSRRSPGSRVALRASRTAGPPRFRPEVAGEWRLVPIGANRQPAAATYLRRHGDTEFRPFTIEVPRIEGGLVAKIMAFGKPLAAAVTPVDARRTMEALPTRPRGDVLLPPRTDRVYEEGRPCRHFSWSCGTCPASSPESPRRSPRRA
jgi:hypothetical protein